MTMTMRRDESDGAAWLKLLAWMSPAFPIGSFAFSHGLEWAFEAADIHNGGSLRDWLETLVRHGSIRADAILLSATWRAPDQGEALNELALSLAPASERHLETAAQGTAFLAAAATAWPMPALARRALAFEGRDIAYPVALGLVCAYHEVPLRATLEAFAHAAAANLISAALRLGVIGQSDGQAIVAALAPDLLGLAAEAERATLADLGTCAWRADIAAMRHETQYTRLFRS